MLIAEYSALREEITKKFDAANRLLEINILATGAFLGLGVRDNVSPIALLFFPIPVMFLSLAWGQHHAATGAIGTYIRTHMNRSGGALHRQKLLADLPANSLQLDSDTGIPNGNIFLLSQGIALVVVNPRIIPTGFWFRQVIHRSPELLMNS